VRFDSWRAGVLLVVTPVNLQKKPRPLCPDPAEPVELLSAAHHPVLFMFSFFLCFCVWTRRECIPHTHTHTHTCRPAYIDTNDAPSSYGCCDFFYSSFWCLCMCAHMCLLGVHIHTHTHTHTPIYPPAPMLSARRATSKRLAVGMRSLETRGPVEWSEGLQRQLESQVAAGSLENEVGSENEGEVW